MSKDQTVTKPSHLFSLTPLKTNCYYPHVALDFTAPVNLTKPSESIAPIFLQDRKSYTPAFVLPADKAYYTGNATYEKTKFEERVLKARDLHQHLDRPKKEDQELFCGVPSSPYCQICKLTFPSYQEHIRSDSHLKELNSKLGNEYIGEMCGEMEGRWRRGRGGQKKKKIRKEGRKKGEVGVGGMETRSKRREEKMGVSSKVVALSINTLCSVGNIY